MIRIARPYISFIIDLDYTVPTLEEKRNWKARVKDKILQVGYLSEIKGGGGNVISIKLVPKGSHNQVTDEELISKLKTILEEERVEKKVQSKAKTIYNIYRKTDYTMILEPGYNDYESREEALKAIEEKYKKLPLETEMDRRPEYIEGLLIMESTKIEMVQTM